VNEGDCGCIVKINRLSSYKGCRLVSSGRCLCVERARELPGEGAACFAKRYAQIGDQMRSAFNQYIGEVREGQFPDEQHSYHVSAEQWQEFEKMLGDARGDR